MTAEKRIGAWIIAIASVIGIAAIFVSDGWIVKFDFWTNLLDFLYIPTFACDPTGGSKLCRIDPLSFERSLGIPTKYVVLVCVAAVAWGVLLTIGVASLRSRKGNA